MSAKFRGQVKIVGHTIRGWLLNVCEPKEPVGFNLRIDGRLRGAFLARKPKAVLMRNMPDVETAFGFEIRILPEWITGGVQEVRFEDPSDDELDLVLRGSLGPRNGQCFAAEQFGGGVSIGAQPVEDAVIIYPPGAREAQAEGRWLDACRLWVAVCRERPDDAANVRGLSLCARAASESADCILKVEQALQVWHSLSEVDPDSTDARRGLTWCHITLADEAERASDPIAAQAHWGAALDLAPEDRSGRRDLRRLEPDAREDTSLAPSGGYRGQLKIAGGVLRGWLVNASEAQEPVCFNLRIDGRLRGLFIAERSKSILMRGMADIDSGFGFEIRILPEWITGSVQEICLSNPADAGLKLALRASLGPKAGVPFAIDQFGGEVVLGASIPEVAMRPAWRSQSDVVSISRVCLDALQEGRFEDAIRTLRSAFRPHVDADSAKRDMASALGRLAKENVSTELRRKLVLEQVELYRALTQSSDRSVQISAQINLATALSNIGQYEEAAHAADVALKWVPNSVKALVAKAKALVPQNAIVEACALYERVVDIEPYNQSLRTTLRILRTLAEEETPEADVLTVAILGHGEPLERVLGFRYEPNHESTQLASWICTTGADSDNASAGANPETLAPNTVRRVGMVSLESSAGSARELWRREVVYGLVESGLLTGQDDASALERFAPFYSGAAARAPEAARVVVITSRNGGFRFGGGEHFLQSAAEHYAEQGYAPVIVGTRPEFVGQDRMLDGLRYVFIEDSVAAFRKFVIENDVALVHAISGMGFIVAEALKFTNIPFVYGVHFWRELLGDAQDLAYFEEATAKPIPRKEFRIVLSRAAVVYANSRYTQKTIEESFGVRCPIV